MKNRIRIDNTLICVAEAALALISGCISQPQTGFTGTTHSPVETPVTALTKDSTAVSNLSATPGVIENSQPILLLSSNGQLSRTDISGSGYVVVAEDQTSENAWLAFASYRPPVVSPDGRWLVLNDGRGNWSLVDLSNNRITAEGHGQIILSPTWSPDGLAFAYIGKDRQLCLYKLNDRLDRCVYQSKEDLLGALWSLDGENIALIIGECCEAEVWLVDTQSWGGVYIDTLSISFQTSLKHEISWLQPANGHAPPLLIKAQKNFSKAVVYYPDTKTSQVIDQPVLELSMDGKSALYSSGEVGNLGGNGIFTPYDGAEVLVNDWSVSPDGEKIAYLVSRKDSLDGPTLLAVISLTEGRLLWKLELPGRIQRLAWEPSGKFLIFDQADLNPADSPIWKLPATGTGRVEVLVKEGFLIGVIP